MELLWQLISLALVVGIFFAAYVIAGRKGYTLGLTGRGNAPPRANKLASKAERLLNAARNRQALSEKRMTTVADEKPITRAHEDNKRPAPIDQMGYNLHAIDLEAVQESLRTKRTPSADEADLALRSIIHQRDNYSWKLDFAVSDTEQHFADWVLKLKALVALAPDWFGPATICVLRAERSEVKYQNVLVTVAPEEYFLPRTPAPLNLLPQVLPTEVLDGAKYGVTFNDYVVPGTLLISLTEFNAILSALRQGHYKVVEVLRL